MKSPLKPPLMSPLLLRRLLPLLRAVVWLAVVYAGLLAVVWWAQERLIFLPQRLPAEHRYPLPPDVHERWVDVPGARLNALHLQQPGARGLVFYLHGNAGNLQSWFVDLDGYRRAGLDLYMLDYRGYGKSSGRIGSEAQLHADVAAAWAQVAPLYAGRQRIVLGRSLGSGLAAVLATQVQPDVTVLVSPYVSMADLALEQHPWIPDALMPHLLRYPLRSDQALPRVRGRIWLVHGRRDTLIPPDHTHRLQALVPHAQVLWLPEAGHNDLQRFEGYWQGLVRAFAEE